MPKNKYNKEVYLRELQQKLGSGAQPGGIRRTAQELKDIGQKFREKIRR